MNRCLSTSKFVVLQVCALLLFAAALFAQETTAGLQGTVKDSSGAVVKGAQVTVKSNALLGEKTVRTDTNGYYRFANLPPGTYSVGVTAEGFSAAVNNGLILEVGHLPTIDFSLQVGKTSTVVEVSGEAPAIDVTTNTNQTNVTQDMITNAPHGYSFQSMIQFAPMARNEPLAGGQMYGGGTGGSLPGSSGNGGAVGYSIGGAADSESAYLVDGIDTENISGGYSNANVPYEFIQEVQIKTSGIEAQYGGALGGVVNVISKSGGNGYHGSGFFTFEGSGTDGAYTAGNHDSIRYDSRAGAPGSVLPFLDQPSQTYVPKADTFRIYQPGFTIGGPIKKDRLWFYLGYAPYGHTIDRTVNFNPGAAVCQGPCPDAASGVQTFHLKNWQYFANGRLDAAVTQKVRVFGEWLYQYTRETGASLPAPDPIASETATFLNSGIIGNGFGILTPISQFDPKHGWSQPNSLYVTGADITLTPQVVATTRFGYFFTNYHDFGWPTTGANLVWNESGVGAVDNNGNALPAGLQQNGGTTTTPYDSSYTLFNASKHYQFNQDVAIFKSGWAGAHNFRLGYQFNRMSNVIDQNGNVPQAFLSIGPGPGISYSPSTLTGAANCGAPATTAPSPGSGLEGEWTPNQPVAPGTPGVCAGQYGYLTVQDFATILTKPATDWNHAFYVQDAWNVGHGLTLNVGLRIEKESLPVPPGLQQPGVAKPNPINFSWGDKIAPRLGAAWGSANGKMKIFGSYGVVNDVMKLLLAQTSWGAQAFEDCVYPLGPDSSNSFTNSDISLQYVGSRACPNGASTVGANFAGGTVPASLTDAGTGISLIENTNFRPWEPVAPRVKPYRQHEFVIGYDYQIAKDWALEARYDRRRLDHVIEDASLADPAHFEMYTIVNPGEGVNKTIDGYANFLTSLGSAYGIPNFAFNTGGIFGTCPSCPPNPKAVRDYDGFELRLTKATSHGWGGLFSYTWSRLWGNYTGLTTTDQTDGGGTGRNSPDTTRAFDEPFYYFGANGKSNNGLLPTDRPNAFKGDVFYTLPWKGMATTFGLFQTAYSGTPITSFTDLGLACCNEPIEAVDIFGRGKFASVTEDPNTGAITLGTPTARRTPWFTQSDFQITHAIKLKRESQQLKISATALNLLNQRAIVNYYQGFNSIPAASQILPFSIFGGASSYQTVEGGYNAQTAINGIGFIKSSQYGLPNQWQLSRNLRLGVEFTF